MRDFCHHRRENRANIRQWDRVSLENFCAQESGMSPLALRFATELTLPKAQRRIDDRADVLALIGDDFHCFEVTAIGAPVQKAMDCDNLWPDVESILPRLFLPSPATWLELRWGDGRCAYLIEDLGDGVFRLSMGLEGPAAPFSLRLCEFRARSILELGERIDIRELDDAATFIDPLLDDRKVNVDTDQLLKGPPTREGIRRAKAHCDFLELQVGAINEGIAKADRLAEHLGGALKFGIAFCVLTLDLINTPGLIGLRQHDPHRALARRLAALRSGSYPLRGWSEVVLKHQTKVAGPTEHPTGATFHKCLHFVRSHRRRYRDGRVVIIPAHWRGDPALGIKRTRYRLAA